VELSKVPVLGSRFTLWLLLKVISGAMIPGGAFAEARTRRAGYIGEVLVLVPALVLGALNTWTVHRVGYALYQRSKRYSEPAQMWWARCMYLGLGTWVAISLFLGAGFGWVVLRAVGK